jgi:hypothetical protein
MKHILLIGALTGLLCWSSSAQTFTNADLFNANLIINGNAETVVNASEVSDVYSRTVIPVPGWEKEGYFTIIKYLPANDTSVYLGQKSPGPEKRGLFYFAGGLSYTGDNSATQTIDLKAAQPLIDTGNVLFELAGYFGSGGWAVDESAELSVQFINANGQVLDSVAVGNVTFTELGGKAGLLKRQTSGKLPTKTRSVRIMLLVHAYSGAADNLSFTLFSPEVIPQKMTINPAVEILMPTEQGKTYQLQYIPDLETQGGWINLGASFLGDGTIYRIFDSCVPGKPHQFYRMVIEQ